MLPSSLLVQDETAAPVVNVLRSESNGAVFYLLVGSFRILDVNTSRATLFIHGSRQRLISGCVVAQADGDIGTLV